MFSVRATGGVGAPERIHGISRPRELLDPGAAYERRIILGSMSLSSAFRHSVSSLRAVPGAKARCSGRPVGCEGNVGGAVGWGEVPAVEAVVDQFADSIATAPEGTPDAVALGWSTYGLAWGELGRAATSS